MRQFLIYFFLIPVFCFSENNFDLVYYSPKNNSYLHNPSTFILIRNKEKIEIKDLKANLHLSIIGSKSYKHNYNFKMADDHKTIIIDPVRDFDIGERVDVEIYYKDMIISDYHFFISNNRFKVDEIEEEKKSPLFPLIPDFTITANNSSYDGNVFFMTGGNSYRPVSIVDTSGNILFSEYWPQKGFDWKVNHDGNLTYFDRFSKYWFIRDSFLNIVDSVACVNGYQADNHDFMSLDNGHKVLIAYDDQVFDMSLVVQGGDPNAIVEGFIIQELDASNNLVFQWRSWDHFNVTDNIYLNLTQSDLNFIHGNAIDIDFDGNFLISSRGLDEITKIDRFTGDVIWRWGGSQNQFNFLNDYPFTHQHSIRSTGVNRYILYDNGNWSSQYIGVNLSRAVEYVIDTTLMTVEKIWDFSHPDSLYAPSTGCVQRLPNGNTFINWGNLGSSGLGAIFTEIDTNQQIVFQMEFLSGQNVYRAHKFDWFFDESIVGCMDSLAVNYSSSFIISDSTQCEYNSLYIGDHSIIDQRNIVRIVDVLGRDTYFEKNKLIFYIYDDGTVEKKIFK